ncbi:MAG: hypothetical protein ACR2FG_13865 [Marmoricola sp.]
MSKSDEDALWRSIVENYGERVSLDAAAADSSAEPTPESPVDTDDAQGAAPPARRDEPDVLDAWNDPDDHFVPPPPPPLPRLEPPRLLAWAGVFGVPILVIALTALKISIPPFGDLLCLAWFVGGFGYLVATMRRDDDHDPGDWDDGARL